ncbi:MAG: hypothetical protein J6M60_00210 [Clostridia bacterium]|nr:hypothetical protein [Clostridia bacterium]
MFIYNVKISGTKLFKIIFVFIIAFVITLCGIVSYKVYKATLASGTDYKVQELTELNNKNYANVLKMVHEDVDTYVGQKIKYSGFVYRVYDLENNQFVLARNMIISSDLQTVVVGFLCQYDDAIKLKDYTWVEIEGKIEKCLYHGKDMPILKITSIKEIQKPEDELVSPPDENYIPTSAIL